MTDEGGKFRVACGQCGRRLVVDRSHDGKKGQCPGCRNVFVIRLETGTAEPPAAPPPPVPAAPPRDPVREAVAPLEAELAAAHEERAALEARLVEDRRALEARIE